MHRRQFLKATTAMAAAALLVPVMGRGTFAQEISSLDIFIPGAPGGGWDLTGRVIDEVMKNEGLVSRSRITNAGGAGGTIGLSQFISQFDGEEDAIFVAGSVLIGATIANKTPVDLSMLTPLARLTGEYEVLVVPAASPIKTLAEFVDALKKDPKSINWAGGATGGLDHIFACLIAREVGVAVDQLSYVAFTGGGGEAMASLLGNQVSCGISGYGEFSEQIAAGNLRPLAISGPERVPGIDIPTLREQGLDVVVSNWRGLFGAPGVDEEAAKTLETAITSLAKSDAWAAQLKTRGWSDQFLPAAEFAAYIQEDTETTRSVLESLGLA